MSDEPLLPLPLRLLFDAVCDGTATAEQSAELEAILRSDEQARRLYRDYCRLHVDLHFVVRGGRAMRSVADAIQCGSMPRAAVATEKKSPVLGFLGSIGQQGWGVVSDHSALSSLLAAVVVLGSLTTLGLAIHGQRQGDVAAATSPQVSGLATPVVAASASPLRAASPVARLVRATECRWNNAEAGFAEGAELTAGQQLELAAGEAQIAFASGAVVVVRGPSILQIESEKSARLLLGRVTARAQTEKSHGFTLHTQTAALVDLGTEFHVQVAADGHSEVQVTAGAVEIQTVRHQAKHRLEVGDYAQVEPGDAGVFAVIESGRGTPEFKFPTIEPPSSGDYADAAQRHAAIRVAEGNLAPDSGPVELLVNGKGQSNADAPHESVFFANNQKGKILLDLGQAIRVQKINSYSWHTCLTVPVENDRYDTRATQRYNLYGYVGDRPPPAAGDPEAQGWTLISRVNTDSFFSVPPVKNRPAQQAVSITAEGGVGRYRYLLWDVQPTHVIPFPPHGEQDQNTFFGEFDVYGE